MNFKLLNDTICGEPRLVAIIDDTNKSLEATTRAVFPAARICIDTQNDRNRMIVLIDHASEAIRQIAENFFMKPDSKVTTKVVAVPYTEELKAEMPAATSDKVEEVKPKTKTPMAEEKAEKQEESQAQSEAATEQELKSTAAENVPTDNTEVEPAAKTEELSEEKSVKSKKKGSWELVWKDCDAVKTIMNTVADKYNLVITNVDKNDPVSKFYNLIKTHESEKSIYVQLNWIDALGMYGVAKKSGTALQAAAAMLTQCSKKKEVYADGKQALQNFAWLSSSFLKKIDLQNLKSFSAFYDQLGEDEKKELVRQIIDDVKKDLQNKSEKLVES